MDLDGCRVSSCDCVDSATYSYLNIFPPSVYVLTSVQRGSFPPSLCRRGTPPPVEVTCERRLIRVRPLVQCQVALGESRVGARVFSCVAPFRLDAELCKGINRRQAQLVVALFWLECLELGLEHTLTTKVWGSFVPSKSRSLYKSLLHCPMSCVRPFYFCVTSHGISGRRKWRQYTGSHSCT